MNQQRIIQVWSASTMESHGSLKSPPASPVPPHALSSTTDQTCDGEGHRCGGSLECSSHSHPGKCPIPIRPPPVPAPPVSNVSLYCISSIQDVAAVVYERAKDPSGGGDSGVPSSATAATSSPSSCKPPLRIAVLWDADDTLVTKRRTVPLESKEVLQRVFGEGSPLVNGRLQPMAPLLTSTSSGGGDNPSEDDSCAAEAQPLPSPPLSANIEHFILSMGTVDDLFAEGRPAPATPSSSSPQPQTVLGQGMLYPFRHVFDRTLTPSNAIPRSEKRPNGSNNEDGHPLSSESSSSQNSPTTPVPPRLVRLGSSKALATYLLIDPIKCPSPSASESAGSAAVKSPPPARAELELEKSVVEEVQRFDDLWSPLRGITIADQLKVNLTGSSAACSSSKLQMVSYFALSGHWDKVVLVDNSLEQLGVLLPLPFDWWSPQKTETEQVAEFSRRLQILAESSVYTTAEREKRVPMPEPPKEFAAFDDDIILNSDLATTAANLLVRSKLERALAAELEDLAHGLNSEDSISTERGRARRSTEVILCHLWTEGYPIILPQELRARRGTHLEPFVKSLGVLERDLFDAYADGVSDFEHRQKDRKLKEMKEAHHNQPHHQHPDEQKSVASQEDGAEQRGNGAPNASPTTKEWKEFHDVIRRYLAEANRVLHDAEHTILARLPNDGIPEERKLIREGCRQARDRLSRQMSIRWGYCGHLRRALYELEFAVVARPDEPFPMEMKQALRTEFFKFEGVEEGEKAAF